MRDLALFYPEGHAAHAEEGHSESPHRVEAVRQALDAAGWWRASALLDPLVVPDEVLQAVHSVDYLKYLEDACRVGERLDGDTYVTPASWGLAQRAAGGAAAVAQAVWSGEAWRGFALTRPPGHHATRNRGMGFCLLNNVAIAAESLFQQSAGPACLAIIDLDLHHGNGTQDIFWRRKDVLFISTHQSPLYPGSGSLDERGEGDGAGYTVNLPLPAGSGDAAFRATMKTVIVPLLDRYQPEILLVSYGFDAHWGDPLGSLQLSADGYGHLIASLADWADAHCQGKIALFLEGGYNLKAASACSRAVVAALLGRAWQDPLGPSPDTETQAWQSLLIQAQMIFGLAESL
ncbi:MAG TPA: histone deacetylase [Anaerolineales bacterium]|nr:histone deacetylase [Anaerolineales bacterium]